TFLEHDSEVLLALFRIDLSGDQQLRKSDDARKRRSQLVADHGHHLVLGAAELCAALGARLRLMKLQLEALAFSEVLREHESRLMLAKGDRRGGDQDLDGGAILQEVPPRAGPIQRRHLLLDQLEELGNV